MKNWKEKDLSRNTTSSYNTRLVRSMIFRRLRICALNSNNFSSNIRTCWSRISLWRGSSRKGWSRIWTPGWTTCYKAVKTKTLSKRMKFYRNLFSKRFSRSKIWMGKLLIYSNSYNKLRKKISNKLRSLKLQLFKSTPKKSLSLNPWSLNSRMKTSN